jgi:hypothetical protein
MYCLDQNGILSSAPPELKNKVIKLAKLAYPTRFYDEKSINILINLALHKS